MYIYILVISTADLKNQEFLMINKSISKMTGKDAEAYPEEMENQREEEQSLSTVAFLAKSLSDENRLRVLLSLREGRLSVSSLVEGLQLSQPLISHHLKELKRSLLVKVERNGPFIYYELADKRILQIIKDLGTVAGELLANRRTF
jgi:ArsR family transcriptional regulator, zinc-responsive transcriptional repressor